MRPTTITPEMRAYAARLRDEREASTSTEPEEIRKAGVRAWVRLHSDDIQRVKRPVHDATAATAPDAEPASTAEEVTADVSAYAVTVQLPEPLRTHADEHDDSRDGDGDGDEYEAAA